MIFIPYGAAFFLMAFLEFRYSFVTLLIAMMIVVSGLLERVVVIGDRNPRYCPACRYDLSGTLAAGITTCPECGCLAAGAKV